MKKRLKKIADCQVIPNSLIRTSPVQVSKVNHNKVIDPPLEKLQVVLKREHSGAEIFKITITRNINQNKISHRKIKSKNDFKSLSFVTQTSSVKCKHFKLYSHSAKPHLKKKCFMTLILATRVRVTLGSTFFLGGK